MYAGETYQEHGRSFSSFSTCAAHLEGLTDLGAKDPSYKKPKLVRLASDNRRLDGSPFYLLHDLLHSEGVDNVLARKPRVSARVF